MLYGFLQRELTGMREDKKICNEVGMNTVSKINS